MPTSPYIYGMHDPTPPDILQGKGWVVITEAIGHDPTHTGGGDYTGYADRGLGVIVRLNNGYYPEGTIPKPSQYMNFARRCANFVSASSGCSHWIIGNEPNHSQERPHGQMITAVDYAYCFRLCRDFIKAKAVANVIIAAIAPWNVESGDWLNYFTEAIRHIVEDSAGDPIPPYDGIALHTYTHGHSPALINSTAKMDPPFEDRYYNFLAYRDFLGRLSAPLPPIYITETNQDEPWLDANTGWVEEAYHQIHTFNSEYKYEQGADEGPIRCLTLYRWGKHDQWYIEGKQGVVDDLHNAMEWAFRWQSPEPIPPEPIPPEEEMNLLNPSLELPYNEWYDAQEVAVAVHWFPFFIEGKIIEGRPTRRPEWNAALIATDPHLVTDGKASQRWFSTNSPMEAGIAQRVQVPFGALCTFAFDVKAWSTDDSGHESTAGEIYISIGIDRTGGMDWQASTVTWTDDHLTTDMNWRRPQVMQMAGEDGYITFFIRAWNKWAIKYNFVVVDNATLTIQGGGSGITEKRCREIAEEVYRELIPQTRLVLP